MLSFKIRNEHFNPSLTYKYSLHLIITHKSFTVMVISDQKKCVVFDKYRYPSCENSHELLANINSFYEEINYLKIRDWEKVVVSFSNDRFALVPSELFSEENSRQYLSVNTVLNSDDKIIQSTYAGEDVVCVFALQKEVKEWIEKIYNSQILSVNNFVGDVLQVFTSSYFAQATNDKLHIVVKDDVIVVLYKDKEGRIAFLNQFNYQTKEDVLYYALLALSMAKVEQKEAHLELWGDIMEDVTLFLKEYFFATTYGSIPEGIMFFNKDFDHIPAHFMLDGISSFLYKN